MVTLSQKKSRAPGPVMRVSLGYIFPLPFIVAGAALLFFGLRNVNRANASRHWPTAEAVIRESRLASQSGGKGGTTYTARIRYEFTVADVVHSGERVGFGDLGSSDSEKYRQIVNRYPVGSKVRATYMPEAPSVAVLEPGIQAQTRFMPGFGFVFFAAGLTMVVFIPHAMRKQEKKAEATCWNAGDSTGAEFPSGEALQAGHPKVIRRAGIAGTEFETAARPPSSTSRSNTSSPHTSQNTSE
jgi:hypothetical protein